MITADLTRTIDSPWLDLEPVRLGEVPAGHGTPSVFVLVRQDEKPKLRLDVYPGTGPFLREQAIVWKRLVGVGVGSAAFVVNLDDRSAARVDVDGYFSSFWSSPDALLVVDATGVKRIAECGSVLWAQQNLGIDGIVIENIDGGIIRGRGCFDPPDQWEPFALSLATGRRVLERT